MSEKCENNYNNYYNRKVVVTGIGMITPAGNNVSESWERVLSGKTAIDKLERFDISNFKISLAAEIKNFNSDILLPEEDKRELKRLDLFCQYALVAVKEAVKDCGIDFKNNSEFNKTRSGVVFGSGIGGMETLEREILKYGESNNKGLNGAKFVSPLYIPMLIANIAAGHISERYGLEGHGFCPVTACATSTHAIGEAFRAIKHGYADIIVAGGSEAAITPTSIAGFSNMTALSSANNKDEGLLAFDKRRNGFIMGEGASALILEEYESAVKRGVKICGEVLGYCANFDAYHMTSPEPNGKGAKNAIIGALNDAKLNPKDIDYINAHGTGTQANDKTETLAIKQAFGEYANKISISSTKGVTGHMLGATGAAEAIFSLLAINNSIIPPTANLRVKDEECDLDYTAINAKEKNIKYALSSSFGFGSTNAVIIFGEI